MISANLISHPDGATPLDPDEMEGLKHRHVTTRGELNHLEQANIESGLQWLGRSKRKDILTEIFVRLLHKKLFGDVWKWAGIFRRTEKSIGIDPSHIAHQLNMLLGNVRYWIEHKTFSAEEIAVRLHHQLVSIHPFPNGNGRHARIMADTVLLKLFDKPAINWAGGLEKVGDRRTQYIDALRHADRGNYEPLFIFAGLMN